MIKFNQAYITGKELHYIEDAIKRRELSGDGHYTKLCSNYFKQKFGFDHNYLTNSGTDSLEMTAILANIQPGDEVIMPSYTFVSTANAFILRGAKIRFVDSRIDSPNMDENLIVPLINNKTKAIVVVHYGGVACNMTKIMALANQHNIVVIEDAAHSIDAYYNNQPLGSIGHFGAFSFHSTKNIVSGEGGLIVVNDHELSKRAEIIREKGTNRTAFFRGEIDKYGWVDVGSSFLPSEITASFLYAQLEALDNIQKKRIAVWEQYNHQLQLLKEYNFALPTIPSYASNNAHLFYLICPSIEVRSRLIKFLLQNDVKAVFHYQALHNSSYYKDHNGPEAGKSLTQAEKYTERLLRLPLFPDLKESQVQYICDLILSFIKNKL